MQSKWSKAGKARSLADIERQRARLRKRLCSEYWVDIALLGRVKLPEQWVCCDHCEIPFPFYYLSHDGSCYECHLAKRRNQKLPGTNFQKRLMTGETNE